MGVAREASERGIRILVTTHEMEEIEERVDEVVMINRGRLVLHDTPSNVMSMFKNIICIEVLSPDRFRQVCKESEMCKLFGKVIDLETTMTVYVHRDRYGEAIELLSKASLEFRVRRCSLRDAFLWWSR